MVSQGGEVAATLLEAGLEIAERRCEGEWLAVGAVKGEPS
jgi:hypothetical protein